ncbi:hypothetical protein DL765_007291 [Monosporascus sp. GIB2]|nr:hypothetical protein DL765_007291 [Monosporascus sp. GIB2]
MSSRTQFPFAKLPKELRLCVWEYFESGSGRRLVLLDDKSLRVRPTFNLISPLFSTTSESRAVAKSMHPVRLSVFTEDTLVDITGEVYENEHDTRKDLEWRATEKIENSCQGSLYIDPNPTSLFLASSGVCLRNTMNTKSATRASCFGRSEDY